MKDKVRKPYSSYIFFLKDKDVRKKITDENPNASFGDISKILGHYWKTMSKNDKKRYIDASIIDKLKHSN